MGKRSRNSSRQVDASLLRPTSLPNGMDPAVHMVRLPGRHVHVYIHASDFVHINPHMHAAGTDKGSIPCGRPLSTLALCASRGLRPKCRAWGSPRRVLPEHVQALTHVHTFSTGPRLLHTRRARTLQASRPIGSYDAARSTERPRKTRIGWPSLPAESGSERAHTTECVLYAVPNGTRTPTGRSAQATSLPISESTSRRVMDTQQRYKRGCKRSSHTPNTHFRPRVLSARTQSTRT